MRKSSRTFSRSDHAIHMNGKLGFLTFNAGRPSHLTAPSK
jgi:hypothetical protein